MRKIVMMMALAALVAAGFAMAAAGPLDGKTFHGEIKEKGKSHGGKDTFIFADGTFHSTACDTYGFGSGAYTATQMGDGWTFTAETHSDKAGTMTWKGTVKGNMVQGTAMTTSPDGKPGGEHTFSGTLTR